VRFVTCSLLAVNVPAWIGGVGGAVGVLVAAMTLVRGLLDRRREQASRIWVWSDHFSYSYAANDDEANEAQIRVHNESDGPVFECGVNLLSWGWKEKRERIAGRLFATIPPHTPSEVTPIGPLTAPPAGRTGILPPLELHFTDGSGRDWIRRPDARLRRVRDHGWQFWRFDASFHS
jgi:hypothetical protein